MFLAFLVNEMGNYLLPVLTTFFYTVFSYLPLREKVYRYITLRTTDRLSDVLKKSGTAPWCE